MIDPQRRDGETMDPVASKDLVVDQEYLATLIIDNQPVQVWHRVMVAPIDQGNDMCAVSALNLETNETTVFVYDTSVTFPVR